MSQMIQSVKGLQILDSRGNPTVAVDVKLSDGTVGQASVPSGASTGEHEAIELRDGDKSKYHGKGVTKAVGNINGVIAEALMGEDPGDQENIDRLLCDLDGTENKSRLGANAILGVSLAVAHAAAKSAGEELFEYLGDGTVLPVPMVNVINGGEHAKNSLDVQEFMLVPVGAPSFSEAVRYAAEVFHTLGKLLKEEGHDVGVGDEGGYAPMLKSTEQAIEFLLRAIEKAGYRPGEQIGLALDVAASELVVDKSAPEISYQFRRVNGPEMKFGDLIAMYEKWLSKYPLVSIEDGLGENDWNGWKALTAAIGKRTQVVGDDLYATNTKRLSRGIEQKTSNSILVKVNQIGTLSETLAAVRMARDARYTAVISHRSGETTDTTIADLAVATNAGQIKTGSMSRGERVVKYNRLLWIEQKLESRARYLNPFSRAA